VNRKVAFFTPHNAFSSAEILREVPAHPLVNTLQFHGQLTLENLRLYTHGWDVISPTANVTWETTHDSHETNGRLTGAIAEPYCRDRGDTPHIFDEQKVRADLLLSRKRPSTMLDGELLDMPTPTPSFWTTLRRTDPSPWDLARDLDCGAFQKGLARDAESYGRATGVFLEGQQVTELSMNAGLLGDKDFDDGVYMVRRDAALSEQMNSRALQMARKSAYIV